MRSGGGLVFLRRITPLSRRDAVYFCSGVYIQTSLQAKAKAEPAFRFYALCDKICRKDVLQEAYERCRKNAGASGVDRQTSEQIETEGAEPWLERLRQELFVEGIPPSPCCAYGFPRAMADSARSDPDHPRSSWTDGRGADHRAVFELSFHIWTPG
jgi:hypothetical protein